jgi:hypothetical protein
MSAEGRIALTALILAAVWIFVALPVIYLPDNRIGELAHKAPIITALTAFAALAVASLQLALNRRNQRETTAKTNFREYLKLCVEHPEFAYGIIPKAEDRAEYEWFIAHFLWAAEELLEFAREDWEENLKLHISYHRGFLQFDPTFRRDDFPAYTETLRHFIDRALRSFPPGV